MKGRKITGMVAALFGISLLAGACGSSSDGNAGTAGGGNIGGSAGSGGAAGTGGCSTSCDDGKSCTIDSCNAGKCTHGIGPNAGSTACPIGQYCTVEMGCIAAPACATTSDCTKAWAGDACKSNIKCEAASSVCTFDILDKDNDGYPPPVCGGGDCNDDDPNIHPGATDICNGKDDDCSGKIDEEPGGTENCAKTSGPGYTCQSGACTCPAQNKCGSACVDLMTDTAHCGSCETACPSTATCKAGSCTCDPATQCAGKCVDKATDNSNCGTCGTTCSAPAYCVNGSCGCTTGQTLCSTSCATLASDLDNCGSCGTKCDGSIGSCANGQCISGCGTGNWCGNCIMDGADSSTCAPAKAACVGEPGCGDVQPCFAACTDAACKDQCFQQFSPAALHAFFAFFGCAKTSCASSGCAYCPQCPVTGDEACHYCLQTACPSQCGACMNSADCLGLGECRFQCDSDACRAFCDGLFPGATVEAMFSASGCLQQKCAGVCK